MVEKILYPDDLVDVANKMGLRSRTGKPVNLRSVRDWIRKIAAGEPGPPFFRDLNNRWCITETAFLRWHMERQIEATREAERARSALRKRLPRERKAA
jgi:hypothetical protein